MEEGRVFFYPEPVLLRSREVGEVNFRLPGQVPPDVVAAHRDPGMYQGLNELLHLHRHALAAIILVVVVVFNATLSLSEHTGKQREK